MQAKKVKGVHSSRMLGLILTLVLFFSVAAFPETGNCAENSVEIETAVLEERENNSVTAGISLYKNPGDLVAGQLELAYDPAFFTAKDIAAGILLEGVLLESNLQEAGVIKIAWVDPVGAGKKGADGLLLKITFLGEKEQPLTLHFTKVELIRADGNLIPFRIIKGEEPANGELAGEIHLQIGSAEALVNGSQVTLNAAPFLKEGRTMVPVRFVGEHFGAKVSWLQETNQVRIEDNRQVILLTINTPSALVNGVEEELDCAAVIVNGTTFVPLRFVGTILGADTLWDGATQSIEIIR